LDQDAALSDAELFARGGGAGEGGGEFGGGFGLGGDEVDAVIICICFESILLKAYFFVEGSPCLARGWDVLARILWWVS
jgi:hypothetical protein